MRQWEYGTISGDDIRSNIGQPVVAIEDCFRKLKRIIECCHFGDQKEVDDLITDIETGINQAKSALSSLPE